MPVALSVNVNAIAELRNRRNLPWPSVVDLARLALAAGAAGITVHPRPDERHIRPEDVTDIAGMMSEEFPDREFNVEGNPDARFIALTDTVRPHQVTLVPDDIRQLERICHISAIDHLISNALPPKSLSAALTNANVQVHCAPQDQPLHNVRTVSQKFSGTLGQ